MTGSRGGRPCALWPAAAWVPVPGRPEWRGNAGHGLWPQSKQHGPGERDTAPWALPGPDRLAVCCGPRPRAGARAPPTRTPRSPPCRAGPGPTPGAKRSSGASGVRPISTRRGHSPRAGAVLAKDAHASRAASRSLHGRPRPKSYICAKRNGRVEEQTATAPEHGEGARGAEATWVEHASEGRGLAAPTGAERSLLGRRCQWGPRAYGSAHPACSRGCSPSRDCNSGQEPSSRGRQSSQGPQRDGTPHLRFH